MKKATIVAIFIIYLASIFLIGFFGMRVKVYGEVRYVTDVSVRVLSSNSDSFTQPEPEEVEDSTIKTYTMKVRMRYAENGSLDIQLIPTFTFKDETSEEFKSSDIDIVLIDQGYADEGWVEVLDGGKIRFKEGGLSISFYIKPKTDARLDVTTSATMQLNVNVF